ncbi:MAG TPA: hypothetical protein VFV34_21375 [Blastocatellia bacterium]|nr:hypothetical protein [Blastocatellia bacterium]
MRRTVIRLSSLFILMLVVFGGEAMAAPPDTMQIWRIQVFFETFNTPDAGSDDSVRVELNANNGTWVDSGFDDWEVGSRTYDLRMDGVTRISDIDYFRVSKTGSGGWCIGRIRLIINGVALYDEIFPSGHWLDNCCGHSTVYFIDDYWLRQRSEWINYVVPARPNIVPVGEMRSRIQCLFGDWMTGGGCLGFRDSTPITVSTIDANTWRVNVDLDDPKPGPVPDPNVDVDFDLTVAWKGIGFVRPDLKVENLHVGYSWPAYAECARTFMNTDFQPRINQMFKNFVYQAGSSFQLAPNGDLHFIPLVINPVPIDFSAPLDVTDTPDTQNPVRKTRALDVRVKTDSEIAALEKTALNVTVSSGLKEDSAIDLVFSLPAEVTLTDSGIEANDGHGTRWLKPRVDLQDGGTTTIRLRDTVGAGKNTTYSLRMMFRPAEHKELHILTRLSPATAELAAKAPSLQAVTSFRVESELITPEGTLCIASRPGRE